MYRPPDRSYLLPEPRLSDRTLDPSLGTWGGAALSRWAAHRSVQMEAVRDRRRTVGR